MTKTKRDPLMTAREVCSFLQISKSTLYNMEKRGEIEISRSTNGYRRIRRSECLRQLREHTPKPTYCPVCEEFGRECSPTAEEYNDPCDSFKPRELRGTSVSEDNSNSSQ